jgi:hypothetical protein
MDDPSYDRDIIAIVGRCLWPRFLLDNVEEMVLLGDELFLVPAGRHEDVLKAMGTATPTEPECGSYYHDILNRMTLKITLTDGHVGNITVDGDRFALRHFHRYRGSPWG